METKGLCLAPQLQRSEREYRQKQHAMASHGLLVLGLPRSGVVVLIPVEYAQGIFSSTSEN